MTTASWMEPAVAATRASTVPSPPSAIGTWSMDAPGHALVTPRAIAAAASAADRLPLNLSGAITTRMAVCLAKAHPVAAARCRRLHQGCVRRFPSEDTQSGGINPRREV